MIARTGDLRSTLIGAPCEVLAGRSECTRGEASGGSRLAVHANPMRGGLAV
jgi:hypothetical protein